MADKVSPLRGSWGRIVNILQKRLEDNILKNIPKRFNDYGAHVIYMRFLRILPSSGRMSNTALIPINCTNPE